MKTETIEICSRCSGKGFIEWEKCVNYHKGDYDIHKSKCTQCDGNGLVKVTVVTQRTVEPYKPPILE